MNELLFYISGLAGRPKEGEVSFDYRCSACDEIRSLSYYFSDGFFSRSSYNYDHELAKVSLGLTASAVSFRSHGASHIVSALNHLGFSRRGIETVKFDDNRSTDDSCAYALGLKRLPDGAALLAVVIRSHRYGGEWVSNAHVVDAAYPDYAAGFKAAADKLCDALTDYISRKALDKSKLKLWITGYSRGGAVANLLGARLNNSGINPHRIFVYTFAAPCTAKGSVLQECPNIFNIISEADAVPRVPPEKWGFRRFGTDLFLPSRTGIGDAQYEKLLASMKAEFSAIMHQTGCGDTEYESYAEQELLLDLLIDYLDDLLDTPEKYAEEGYQDILMEFMASKMGGADFDLGRFFSFLLRDNRELEDGLRTLMAEWEDLSRGERTRRIGSFAAGLALQQAKEKTPAMAILRKCADILLHYGARVTASKLTGRDKDYYYEQLVKLIVDAYNRGTASPVLMQHWPESYLAWLRCGSEQAVLSTHTYKRNSIK